jgi:DNA invertase Pin-like site-specific DNA recombinase
MFRAGLYARVSTNDQQTLPMQMRALRDYAARRGWTVAMQVRDVGSGAAKRQARERLIEAARRREIDVMLVGRLESLGSLGYRSAGNLARTRASGRRVRFTDRSARSDYTGRSRDGGFTRDFR